MTHSFQSKTPPRFEPIADPFQMNPHEEQIAIRRELARGMPLPPEKPLSLWARLVRWVREPVTDRQTRIGLENPDIRARLTPQDVVRIEQTLKYKPRRSR